MGRIRILIADDHALVRKGLEMVLGVEPDFTVVGQAGDTAEALAQAERLQPDIILLDLKMPGMKGRETVRAFRQVSPRSRLIILTGFGVSYETADLLEEGVDGYLLKDASPDELVQALRAVSQGQAYLHPAVTRVALNRLRSRTPQQEAQSYGLTPRELEVLRLMATSATYEEIAHRLGVSVGTVRTHVKHILHKLGQPTRTQAVLAALRAGLIPPP